MTKNRLYLVLTAGRGPVECGLAVAGIQKRFQEYLKANEIQYSIVSQKKGEIRGALETIQFEVFSDNVERIKPWLGTIQWVCKSPIRSLHKRKNWFVKCHQVVHSDGINIHPSEVEFQTFRASGPGGQHRNKVETAVRLIHRKSGISVTATDGKSQAQNKKKAWAKLYAEIEKVNSDALRLESADKWSSSIEIERGNPVKVFEGRKFNEKR
ncbi:MAG: peptide chain release factor H [Saprospiraceae bacterium]|nr:peptide chain release factor H [Saprospiraceae bacterium]